MPSAARRGKILAGNQAQALRIVWITWRTGRSQWTNLVLGCHYGVVKERERWCEKERPQGSRIDMGVKDEFGGW